MDTKQVVGPNNFLCLYKNGHTIEFRWGGEPDIKVLLSSIYEQAMNDSIEEEDVPKVLDVLRKAIDMRTGPIRICLHLDKVTRLT